MNQKLFVCKMGAGPSTNLCSIGGDLMTQLIFLNYIFFNFVFLHKKRWQRYNKRKLCCWWPTDPIKINKIIFKCLEMPKVNGFSWMFVCTMGMGPRINLYAIGCDLLTQLNLFNYIFLNFVFLHKKRWPW